jgi:hypothetical protein
MGPASSTFTIPLFCINHVKHQNGLGNKVTRNDLKSALKMQYDSAPWMFGVSKSGNEPASWETSVYPTFRSMYSRMKNLSGGQIGLEGKLKVVTVDGVDYVFDLEDTFLKANIGKSFKQYYEGEEPKPTDIHTTLQYKICEIGVAAGYKIFVPYKNRNIKIDNGLTISGVFGEQLVDDFKGITNITREIDVILVDEKDGHMVPVRSYEVENSTGVVSGISRMLALDCIGVVVSPHQQYKEKFDTYMDQSFKEMKGKIIYKSSKEVFKFAEAVEDFQDDAFSQDEIKNLIDRKI